MRKDGLITTVASSTSRSAMDKVLSTVQDMIQVEFAEWKKIESGQEQPTSHATEQGKDVVGLLHFARASNVPYHPRRVEAHRASLLAL